MENHSFILPFLFAMFYFKINIYLQDGIRIVDKFHTLTTKFPQLWYIVLIAYQY